MEFGWINLFGAIVVVLIMVPNIFYALSKKEEKTEVTTKKFIVILEQIGRYSCIVLMCLPILVWRFGFGSSTEFLVYIIVNAVLILLYYIFWIMYSKKKTLAKAFLLAIIPTMIFLISGLLLRHWLLVAAAFIFGVAHVGVIYETHKK